MSRLGTTNRPAVVRVRTQAKAEEILSICNRHGWQVIVGVEPAGKVAATVGVHREDPAFNRRTHGAALSHDESEIWICDPKGRYLWVFDNTVFPPVLADSVALSFEGHGWVHFSSDGKHVWTHSGDIIDRKTRAIAHTLRGPDGNPIRGSKYFEAHFLGDSLVWVSKQFGLGFKNASPFSPELARIRTSEKRTGIRASRGHEVWTLAGKRILRLSGPARPAAEAAGSPPGLENGIFLMKSAGPGGVGIRKFASMR